MSVSVSLAGVNYSIPNEGDGNYAQDLTAYLVALANNTKVFQVSSANFPLQQETSFGSSYGLKVAYIKSQATNPAGTGIVRMGNNESLVWRNAGNSADLSLKVNSSNNLEYNGASISIGGTPVQTAITVSDTSTIDLTLSSNDITADVIAGSIDDSHIASLAAIAYSKLNLSGSIVNSDISNSAAIALTKLATVTSSKALQSSASGVIEASTVTTTELSYLSGATSSVQTQINAKQDASTAVTLTGTQTLTNKTISGTSNTINNVPAANIVNTPAGNLAATDVQGALNELQTDVDTRALNSVTSAHISATTGVHGVTGSVVGTSDAQVITNKDIDGGTAANTRRVTLPKAAKATLDALTRKAGTVVFDTDSNKPYYDDGSQLRLIGSGSGGATNFLSDGDAEGSNPWNLYVDAAGAAPVDGTGGTGSQISIGTTSTTPLSGTKSFILAHINSVNTQGHGISYDFTIDTAQKGKALTVSFDYILNLGAAFTAGNPSDRTSAGDSDVTVWIYDVTNSQLIQPSNYRLYSNSQTIADKYSGQFQSSSNSTSYRLILHVGVTTIAPWTLKFDSVSVAPTNYVYGSPITDLKDYGTITIGATTTAPTKGTIANDRIQAGRIGDNWRIRGEYKQSGGSPAAGSGDYLFTLPNGLSFDSSKVAFFTTVIGASAIWPTPVAVGTATAHQTINSAVGMVIPYDATRFRIGLIDNNGTNGNRGVMGSGYMSLSNSTISFSFDFQAPMLGYSSSVQMSDSADTRVVAARASIATGVSTTNTTPLNYNSIDYDTHGALTPGVGVWKYTAPVSGYYRVSAAINFAASGTLYLYKMGNKYADLGAYSASGVISGDTDVYLNSGEYIDIRSNTTGTPAGGTSSNWVSISRLSGPSAIAATETIAASYWCSANVAASTTTPINFDSKEYDTHGAVTTGSSWRFTAPAAGLYNIGGLQNVVSGGSYIFVYKNGNIYKNISYGYTSALAVPNNNIRLNAGDYIDLRPTGSISYVGGTLSTLGISHIQITRIGL